MAQNKLISQGTKSVLQKLISKGNTTKFWKKNVFIISKFNKNDKGILNQGKILVGQNPKNSNFSPKNDANLINFEKSNNEYMEIEFDKKQEYQDSFIKDLDKENEFKKNKIGNDSFINMDNSYLENYSTANSNVENDKKKQKFNPKNNMEYSEKEDKLDNTKSIDMTKENEMDVSEESLEKNEEVYIDEIFENLKNEELNNKYKINPNYFIFQNEINNKMRIILINWLAEVHTKLNFKEETFYTTIYIIDAYLSRKFIKRTNFQLLGVTALYIATKLNEIYIRRIKDYVFITDNAYREEELVIMESDICKTLNFNFLIPTSLSFYEIISKKFGLDKDIHKYNFGKFLIQSFLINGKSLNYDYSLISYAVCYMVIRIFEMDDYKYFMNNYYNLFNNGKVNKNSSCIIKECSINICKTIKEMVVSNVKSTIKKFSVYDFNSDIKKLFILFNDI